MHLPHLPQPIPKSIAALPVQRGFPVPWFVAWTGKEYDFRCIDARKLTYAVREKVCWVCGQSLTQDLTFPIGPMCAINRTISEPPSHWECAHWSAIACPFLNQTMDERRETNLPDGVVEPGGIAIKRQPGAILLWQTTSYDVYRHGNGLLFKLGDPTKLLWLRDGREATRQECLDSIDSGYPILYKMAAAQGKNAIAFLQQQREAALELLPPSS